MADHSYHQCQHVLAFCVSCDAPYCTACKRDWPGRLWITPSYPGTVPYWGTTTIGGVTNGVTTTAAAAHAHN